MLEEERNHHPVWKFLGIVLATFIGAYLAFYFVVDTTFNRMMNPEYQLRKMEKMMQHQEKKFHKFEDRVMQDNPFEPRMAPMLVNLAKEANEYKVIVNLKPLGGDEKNVNVKLDENIVTISGEVEKNSRHGEKIMNFSQSFYLDENLNLDKITKVRKGDKYIITIPFEE